MIKYSYKINGKAISEPRIVAQGLAKPRILEYMKAESLKLYRHNEWEEASYSVNWALRGQNGEISDDTLVITLHKMP